MYGCATWTGITVVSKKVDTRKRGYSFLDSVLQAMELGGGNGRASYRESQPTYLLI